MGYNETEFFVVTFHLFTNCFLSVYLLIVVLMEGKAAGVVKCVGDALDGKMYRTLLILAVESIGRTWHNRFSGSHP